MKAIAVVIPWFGKDLKGGAEQLAWQVATRLAQRGHRVDVLTTCCRSFHDDWATNHLEAGVSQEQGMTIRRFPADRRDQGAFGQLNLTLLGIPSCSLKPGVNPVSQEEANLFVQENINSRALLRYLRQHSQGYDAFLFIPYLYGPILTGLPLVAERAFLQPCLHDEVYAYLPAIEHIFRVARGLLFNSEGEALLAQRLYGPGIWGRSAIVGAGVEVDPQNAQQMVSIRSFQSHNERFILYLGRKDATKNVDQLLSAYSRFRKERPYSTLKLVLAGPGSIPIGAGEGIVDVGIVEEPVKAALLTQCLALFQPSRNESFSRAIMEAWLSGRPVAAHRQCLATAAAVDLAHGGWLAATEGEWAKLFAAIDDMSAEELAQYGEQGRRYASQHAVWDLVISRYEQVLSGSQQERTALLHRKRKLKEIHQLLPSVAYGDAISNNAFAIRDYLHGLGYASDIFVEGCDTRVAHEVKIFRPGWINERAGLLYHHSIGSGITPVAMQHRGPKCLIYHNITPAKFFAPYQPEVVKILEDGRRHLYQLAQHFPLSVGVSAYNASELAACGFPNPGVLPIMVDPHQWNLAADPQLMKELQDGKANILFVGRLVPNKRQEHLVEAFAHYLTTDGKARLWLVGETELCGPYTQSINNLIDKYRLSEYVRFTGLINDNQLIAYYRTAHLFWSMSEHEGFCVPMVEAMWFDVPILAYKSSAVPETLAEAGILFTTKEDLLRVAALAKLLVWDETLRKKVLAAQRKRRVDFLPEVIWEKLEMLIDRMESCA